MPNYVSPGVYVIEKDISDYLPSVNTSIVGITGFASKGPVDTPTLITNQNQLVRTFGAPSENITGQALEGALEILEETNTVYFNRSADSALDASAKVSVGFCPAVVVNASSYGIDRDLYLKVNVYNNAGVKVLDNKSFSIPAGTLGAGGTQAAAIRKVVGGGLQNEKVGVFYNSDTTTSGHIVGSFAGSGAYVEVSAYSDSTFTTGLSALNVVNPSANDITGGLSGYGVDSVTFGLNVWASSVTAYGGTYVSNQTEVDGGGYAASPNASAISYLVESLYPGAGYNGGFRSDGTASGNTISVNGIGAGLFTVNVLQDGAVEESFTAGVVSASPTIDAAINTGETNTTSEIIKGNVVLGINTPISYGDGAANFIDTLEQSFLINETESPIMTYKLSTLTGEVTYTGLAQAFRQGARFNKLVEGDYSLAGGNNGDGDVNTLVGTGATEPKTGVHAFEDESLNVGIALVPGVYNEAVQNELISVAESTQAFLALVSPPYGIGTTQDAIDWHNGKSTTTAYSRTSAINSSYAAIFFPHVKVFSTFDKKDRWYDPTIFAARQMAFTDSVADSWFAPAGFRRGRLTKPTDVEVKITQGDRDSMYSGGNAINPISSFPQQGITIFGQRTAQRSPSALDRINVRRLMIYIRKVLLQGTGRFVFEPNDEFTWEQLEAALNPFLDDILRRRGIQDFRVICDETVNTPARVDRNELWCKVILKPTKTAEIIIFELNLTSQSADITTL